MWWDHRLEAKSSHSSVSEENVCTEIRSYVYRKTRKVKIHFNTIFMKGTWRKMSARNLKVLAEPMKSHVTYPKYPLFCLLPTSRRNHFDCIPLCLHQLLLFAAISSIIHSRGLCPFTCRPTKATALLRNVGLSLPVTRMHTQGHWSCDRVWQTRSLRSLILIEACSEVNLPFWGVRKPTSSISLLYHHPHTYPLLLPSREFSYHLFPLLDTSCSKQSTF